MHRTADEPRQQLAGRPMDRPGQGRPKEPETMPRRPKKPLADIAQVMGTAPTTPEFDRQLTAAAREAAGAPPLPSPRRPKTPTPPTPPPMREYFALYTCESHGGQTISLHHTRDDAEAALDSFADSIRQDWQNDAPDPEDLAEYRNEIIDDEGADWYIDHVQIADLPARPTRRRSSAQAQTPTPPALTPDLSAAAAPPALTAAQKANFETLKRAHANGDLALVSCRVRATGEPVAVLAAIAFDGQEYEITPLAMQIPGDPYEYLADPTDDGGEPHQPAAK